MIEVPEFRVQGGLARQSVGARLQVVEDSEEFMEIVTDVSDMWPGRSVYDVCRSYFRRVCPLSLMDEVSDEMIRLEARAERYGAETLPFPAGAIPIYIFEAFDAISAGRNQHYRDEDERRAAKSKK